MKKVILALAIVSVSFVACNNSEEKETPKTDSPAVAPVKVDSPATAPVKVDSPAVKVDSPKVEKK